MKKDTMNMWFLSVFAVTIKADVRRPLGVKMCMQLCHFHGNCREPTYNRTYLSCNLNTAAGTPKTITTALGTQGLNTTEKYDRIILTRTKGYVKLKRRKKKKESQATIGYVIDGLGKRVNPGDGVFFRTGPVRTFAIYVGHLNVVGCTGKHIKVFKSKLPKKKSDFKKMTIRRGRCKIYKPQERITRAESWVGKLFNLFPKATSYDLLYWVFTGKPRVQARNQGCGMSLF